MTDPLRVRSAKHGQAETCGPGRRMTRSKATRAQIWVSVEELDDDDDEGWFWGHEEIVTRRYRRLPWHDEIPGIAGRRRA